MLKNYVSSAVFISILALACLTESRYLSDDEDRVKRQAADVKMAHYLTLLKLQDRLPSWCTEIGCGLIDIGRLFKRSDQRIAELKAEIALQRRPDVVIGHGLLDLDRIYIQKRTASDQRIAELMALIALSRGGGLIGHGRIDPSLIGKRKREAPAPSDISGFDRLRLLSSLISRNDEES